MAGVPLICWPYFGDQPFNAMLVSLVHNVGYELLEVRDGPGLRPLYRLKGRAPEGTLEAIRREIIVVLELAYGEDGLKKRKKAKWFQQKFSEEWKEGGTSSRELRKVVENFGW